MKTLLIFITVSSVFLVLIGCTDQSEPVATEGRKVEASGKETTGLEAVPEAVLAVAREARPDLNIAEAEYETRGGNEYYDVGGKLPDGSKLELDMTLQDGAWTVVEVQRDIGIELAPAAVRDALSGHAAGWTPDRIIESDQGDGVIVYEFFGPGDTDEPLKIEIKFEDDTAEVLVDEWLH